MRAFCMATFNIAMIYLLCIASVYLCFFSVIYNMVNMFVLP